MVCGAVDGFSVRQDAEKWSRDLKNVLDMQVPSKKGNFLTKGRLLDSQRVT
jgi:hypothetical protein